MNLLNFKDLGIKRIETINALKKLNISDPTPVQEKAIPLILKGHNIMAHAKT